MPTMSIYQVIYGVYVTYNVADLSPYLGNDYVEDLRSNSSSQGKNDGGPSLIASINPNPSKSKLMDSTIQAQEDHTGSVC